MLKRYNQLYNQDVQGLLTSQGQAWQHMRREIQQEISSPRAARAYVKNQMSVAEEFLERLTGLRDKDGTVTDFLPEIYKYVTEAIGIVCFDGRLGVMDPDNTEGQQFIEAVSTSLTLTQKELSSIPLYKIMNTSMFNKYCRAMNIIKKFSLHALSRHPEVQQKVYDEIKSLSPRDINNGALDHTSYLRAFLKETLR
ncbi:probable cytochrome P450 12d1 distal, mitochondrial [Patella vulgata]|uniref:probable cytochrome P450 12d1 distal, mitochondrial n=1 Tax=Patella vulgata TaxID=6465 RepID=UPI0024A91E09|nr:probable cytochrome P450 12d1 distal, mitochondrial [Patella vulgata]